MKLINDYDSTLKKKKTKNLFEPSMMDKLKTKKVKYLMK